MAKLDQFRKIRVEDYDSDYNQLISKLAETINPFMDQVVIQMNGNIDFGNLKQEIVYYTVEVDANGTPTKNNKIATSLANPIGLIVINTRHKTSSSTYPTGAVDMSYSKKGKVLEINDIRGLQASQEFTLTLLVIGG